MRPAPPRITLVHLPRVGSTMDALDELIAAGTPEWTVVLADEQTEGRGRAGRRWEAEQGSALLCSVLVGPRSGSITGGMLAIGVGVAVAELLESLGIQVELKWPNDILLHGRKLGGILIRARHDVTGPAVNVGIGLNLTRSRDDNEQDRAVVADAFPTVPRPVDMLPGLTAQLDDVLHGRDASAIQAAWTARAAYLDETVSVDVDGETVRGRLAGIGGDGALLIDVGEQAARRVVAGDLVRGPRPSVAAGPSILSR